MSYSGTVRCGFCYERGHNKRTCGDYNNLLQRQYKRRKQQYIDALDNNNLVEAQVYERDVKRLGESYTKRTGCDPDTGASIAKTKEQKKQAKAARMQNITCSYCTKRGHTRRTCETLKTDKKVYVKATQLRRENFMNEAKDLGVGVGMLANMTRYGYFGHGENREWGQRVRPMLLKNIMWDDVLPQSASRELSVLHFVDCARLMGDGDDYYTTTNATLSTVRGRLLEGAVSLAGTLKPPAGWLEGTDIDLSTYFISGQERSYDMHISESYDSSGANFFREARKSLGL